MSYILDNFQDYIARENLVLTKVLFSGGDTAKFARLISGVKGKSTIPHVINDATLQKGSCPSPSGDAVGSTVDLEVSPFTVHEQFCNEDLQTKFPNMVLAPGSSNHDAPKAWEDAIIDNKISSINEQLEVMYWQGDTDSGDLFDGFIKQIDELGTAVDGNLSAATEITLENVIEVVESMRTAAPAKVKRHRDFTILVGDDVFDMYIQALKVANLYHYSAEHSEGVIRIGGSGATLRRVYGLNETSRMFASVGYNFIIGADVENEKDIVHMYYDEATDRVGLRIKGKAGVTVSNPEEIVEFTLSV